MIDYARGQINRYELTRFDHCQIGKKALLGMGFAPYQFVSAWLSIATMVYFGEPVLVQEPLPLKSFFAGRLDNRNPLNPYM